MPTRWESGRTLWLASAAGLLLAGAAPAEMFERNGFSVYGDFRARLEADFDSRQADGSERDDRNRARVRVRLGAEYAAGEHLTFGVRLRSGSDDSQQSAHVTVVDFDGNDTGDAHFNFDKWFMKAEAGGGWGWIGRNSLPLWKQNELVWDDDVTTAGLAVGYESDGAEAGFTVNAGYFSLPVGMRELSGNLALAQAVFRRKGVKVGVGLLDVDADPDDPDGALLLRGNGARDYQIWVASLQATAGRWTFGVDGIHNGESYPASEALRDEVDGYAGSLRFDANGGDSGRGWHAVYTYAHVEALAVASSYAQDDWVRWGSATQTRASDLKGHELRFVKALAARQNLVFRLYLAEAITTGEDGNRFRIDWNVKF